MFHTILHKCRIFDICIEYSRGVILAVGLSRSPPSIEDVDLHINPQSCLICNQDIESIQVQYNPNSLSNFSL